MDSSKLVEHKISAQADLDVWYVLIILHSLPIDNIWIPYVASFINVTPQVLRGIDISITASTPHWFLTHNFKVIERKKNYPTTAIEH